MNENPTNGLLEQMIKQYGETPSPVAAVDRELRILWANRAALESHPYTRQTNGMSVLLEQEKQDQMRFFLEQKLPYTATECLFPFTQISFTATPVFSQEEAADEQEEPLGLVFFDKARKGSPLTDKSYSAVTNFSSQTRESLSVIFTALDLIYRRMEYIFLTNDQWNFMKTQLSVINQRGYQIHKDCIGITKFSRYANGVMEQEKKNVDICAHLTSLCAAVKGMLRGLGIVFCYSVPSEMVVLHCDQEQIAYAILYIISNSCKAFVDEDSFQEAVPMVGARIKEERDERDEKEDGKEEKRIELKVSVKKQQLVVAITDNGVGMSEEISQKIWEPYFSFNPRTGGRNGLGLGLTVAQQIVLQHQGSIAVTSALGKGTTVAMTFSLPKEKVYGPLTVCMKGVEYTNDRFTPIHVIFSDLIAPPLE